MFIAGINLPKKLAGFVDQQNKINFAALEQQPSKLLKFYLAVKNDPLPRNDIEKASAIFTRQYILDKLLAPGTLSDYHFIKLIFSCPELQQAERKKEVRKHLNAFLEQLTDYDNPKLLKQASKVSALASKTTILSDLKDSRLYQSFVPSDARPGDPPLRLARLPFVLAFPAWRPMLVGSYIQETLHLPMPTEMLMTFYRFMRGKPLPKLDLAQLIGLYSKAHELQYDPLRTACCDALIQQLTSLDTALDVLLFALTHEDAKLINACIAYLNRSHGAKLRWTPLQGLEITIQEPPAGNLYIARKLSSYVGKVIFPNQASVSLSTSVVFPNAEAFELHSDIDPAHMNLLGALFPKARKCAMPQVLYDKLTPEHVASLARIELLTVKAEKKDEPRSPETLFPNLKSFFYSYPRNDVQDRIHLQKVNSCLYCRVPNLTSLQFTTGGFSETQENTDLITDDVIIELVNINPSFRDVNLSKCTKFTEKGALALSYLESLEKLYLNDCTQLTDRMVLAILSGSRKKLVDLSLDKCHLLTDRGIRAFKDHIQKNYCDCNNHDCKGNHQGLEGFSLSLSGCQKVSGEAIASILSDLPVQDLNFSHCPQITNSQMQNILSKAFPTAVLNLSHCPQLTDLDPNCPQAFELYELDLSYCSNLTERSFSRFAHRGSPTLLKVNFSGCPQVSSAVIKTLVDGDSTGSFSFNDCPQLTDDDIRLLATNYWRVSKLHLRNCSKLTDAIVPYIASMIKLQELDLRGCPLVTEAAKQEIFNLRRLKRFDVDTNLPIGSKRTGSEAGL